jgi:hypothetical protein
MFRLEDRMKKLLFVLALIAGLFAVTRGSRCAEASSPRPARRSERRREEGWQWDAW